MGVTIYVLIDPRDGDVRYVGASKDPLRRLLGHLLCREKTHKAHWLRSLLRIGLVPQLLVLDVVAADVWQEAERAWIALLRSLGCRLTNATDGGEGVRGRVGWQHSSTTRAKIALAATGRPAPNKGLVQSPELIAKRAAARRGKGGHRWTLEEREAIRQRMRNRRLSDEHKARISVALRGRRRTWVSQ